ncbi:MAG: hypothetical protein K8W52_35310 [Deltaproteobacteria bacterium]|nr:hypothetical protein [Deltaproteobacteria bacterium]
MSPAQSFSVTSSIDNGSFNNGFDANFNVNGDLSVTIGTTPVAITVTGGLRLHLDVHGSIESEHWEVKTWLGTASGDRPKWGAMPSVWFDCNPQWTLKVDGNPAAQRLFDALDPTALVGAPDALPGLLISGIADAIAGKLEDILGHVGLDGFPFSDLISDDIKSAIRDRLRDKVRELATNVTNAVRDAFTGLTALLKDALRKIVDDILAKALSFGADVLRKAAAVLGALQVGAAEIASRLTSALATLGSASVDKAQQALALAAELVDLIGQAGVGAVRTMLTTLTSAFATVIDDLGQLEAAITPFARRAFAAIGDTAGDAASLLVTIGSVATSLTADLIGRAADRVGAIMATLIKAFIGAVTSIPFQSLAAHLVGAVVAAARATVDGILAQLLGPLFESLRFTRDEVLTFVHEVGENTLVKQVATWMHHTWDKVVAAITNATAEVIRELKDLIDQIAGFFRDCPGEILDKFERMKHLFGWLQQLPNTIFGASEIAKLPERLASFGQIQSQGWLNWLRAEAEASQRTMVGQVKHLLDEGNHIKQWFQDLAAEADKLLGGVAGEGEAWFAAAQDRLKQFEQWERDLEDILFAGSGGESPFSVCARAHGLAAEPIEVHGANLELGKPMTTDSLIGSGEDFVGGISSQLASQISFLALEGRQRPMIIPPPTEPGDVAWADDGVKYVDIPIKFPFKWEASVAVAHLPAMWVIDMRYHMPYGDMARYWVCDRDGDGKVDDADVEAVRAAVNQDDKYVDKLDSDGDGKVTAKDLELVMEQRSRYLNGVMWRPSTAALSFYVSPQAGQWAHVAFGAPIQDDSIPEKLDRHGLLNIYEMQFRVPLVDYPVRVHLEERIYMDTFPRLALFGFAPPGFPSIRYDLVVVGGDTARDFQLYVTSEPWNPLLRTWTFKGTLVLRGLISGAYFGVGAEAGAGAAGRADLRIQMVYESGANLVEVLAQWHDRLANWQGSQPRDWPVPYKMIEKLLEYTELPRLCRAFIGIAGPVLDLLFDWTDPKRHLRAALGYIHQTVLGSWKPCPTWDELAVEIDRLPPDKIMASYKAVLASALRAVQQEVGAAPDAPMFYPRRVKERALAAIDAQRTALLAAALEAAASSPPPSGRGGGRARPTGPLVTPEQALANAKAAVLGLFQGAPAVRRFVAGIDQLIDVSTALPGWLPSKDDLIGGLVAGPKNVAGADTQRADIPGLGAYTAFDPHIWQIPSKDMVEHWDQIVGNPLRRAIYHSTVDFAPDAPLYAVPRNDPEFVLGTVGAHAKGVVEGVVALEDASGAWWFLVRVHGDWVTPKGPQLKEFQFRETRVPPELATEIPDNEDAYKEVVGDDAYARTKNMNKQQRAYYWETQRRLQANIPESDGVEFKIETTGAEDAATVNRAGETTGDDDWFGWMRLVTADVKEQIRYYGEALSETAARAIAPDALVDGFAGLFHKLPDAAAQVDQLTEHNLHTRTKDTATEITRRANVTRFLASPLNTLDDVRWAGLARGALMRIGLGDGTEEDQQIAATYHACMGELRARVFGAGHDAEHSEGDVGPIVRKLDEAKQAHFWLHASAWLKCMYYVPRMAEDFVHRIAPPLFAADLGGVAAACKEALGKMADFSPEEAALAAQAAMPYVKEAVIAIVEMCQKIRSAADFISSGGKGKLGIEDKIDIAGADPGGPTIGNLGAYIFRLFMDDSGTPGAAADAAAREKKDKDAAAHRGGSMDSAIGITGSVEGKGVKPQLPQWPTEEAYEEYVGEAGYAATRTMSWAERRAYWEEEAYKQQCGVGAGEDYYDQTKDMTWPQREEFWKRVAKQQAAGKDGPVDTSGIDKIKDTYAQGELGIKFGRDKLGFTISCEGGGGVGAGAGFGASAGAAPTGNARLHFVKPTFSVDLIKNADSAAIAIRFFVRFAYHFLDAIVSAVAWNQRASQSTDPVATSAGGFFWTNVFSLFAIKEALNDITNDHAEFVAAMLDRLEFEFGFDVSVAAQGEVGVGIEASAAIKGRGKVSVATLLAPLLDLFMGGARPSASGASLVDRIVPHVDFHIDDRFQCKVHAAIGALEVESSGDLLHAKLSIPKGSPMRTKLQNLGAMIEDAVFAWTDRFKEPEPEPVRRIKLVLAALDTEVYALLKAYKRPEGSVDAALATVSHLAEDCMRGLKGEPRPPPDPPREPMAKVLQMLVATKVHGVALAAGPSLEVSQVPDPDPKAKPAFIAVMTVDDTEKAAAIGSGWAPPEPPKKLGDRAAWKVALPLAPSVVAWSTYDDAARGVHVQGLVAGFDRRSDAEKFAQRRNLAWVDDAVETSVWEREAKHWAWVDTDLVPTLAGDKAPLPTVELEGSNLWLRFPLVELTPVLAHPPRLLAAGTRQPIVPIWKLTLIKDATLSEIDELRDRLAINRAAAGISEQPTR